MSEYQYYEFVAIDRPLCGEVRALSTRAHITPTSFVDTYEWGNFRGDPRVLIERYYDAFLYLANWGTHWLSFRVRGDDPHVRAELLHRFRGADTTRPGTAPQATCGPPRKPAGRSGSGPTEGGAAQASGRQAGASSGQPDGSAP